MADEIGTLYAKAGIDHDAYTRGLLEMRAEMTAFAASVDRNTQAVSKNTTSRLGTDMRSELKKTEGEFDKFARGIDKMTGRFAGPGGVIGMFGAAIGLLPSLQKGIRAATTGFQGFLTAILPVGNVTSALVGGVGSLGGVLADLAGPLGVIVVIGGAWATVMAVATFALYALSDAVGTVLAIVGSLVAPLGLVIGLLGLVGGGFFLAGEKVLSAKKGFDSLRLGITQVKGEFANLLRVLISDFTPEFMVMIHAASVALTYFNQLAHMPLDQAFRSLATRGVAMLGQAINSVADLVAKPIRMAFRIAFSGQGPASNEVASWYHRMMAYLFTGSGLTKQQTMHIPIGASLTQGVGQGAHTDALFGPFVAWFQRHDFSKQGIQIGHQLVHGMQASGLGGALAKILGDAGHKAGSEFVDNFAAGIRGYIKSVLLAAMSLKPVEDLWSKTGIPQLAALIETNAGKWKDTITTQLGYAWNTVWNDAQKIWGKVIHFLENPLSIHINWPSIPGWLSWLMGGGGSTTASAHRHGGGQSAASHGSAGATGAIVNRPTFALIGEKGPEAVVPLNKTPGNFPLTSGGGGRSGDTYNVTVMGNVMTERQLYEAVWSYFMTKKQRGNQGIFGTRTAPA